MSLETYAQQAFVAALHIHNYEFRPEEVTFQKLPRSAGGHDCVIKASDEDVGYAAIGTFYGRDGAGQVCVKLIYSGHHSWMYPYAYHPFRGPIKLPGTTPEIA
jgi:hypothetical protein